LIFAGRVGSGTASELGSMILGHQVDTLRAFGVDPIKKLVTPRILGSVVMLPALTVVGDAVALIGGYFIAGALVQDERLVGEVKETLLEIRSLAEEMKILTKDIKEHPEKYFKFSLF
jgi:hypothetical protein